MVASAGRTPLATVRTCVLDYAPPSIFAVYTDTLSGWRCGWRPPTTHERHGGASRQGRTSCIWTPIPAGSSVCGALPSEATRELAHLRCRLGLYRSAVCTAQVAGREEQVADGAEASELPLRGGRVTRGMERAAVIGTLNGV